MLWCTLPDRTQTDFTDFVGYTNGDIAAMVALVSEHKLIEKKIGIVLAVNARSLVRNMSPFDGIMSDFPLLQILAWTGKGEPQLPRSVIENIEDHFEARGCLDRVGFDCQVSF